MSEAVTTTSLKTRRYRVVIAGEDIAEAQFLRGRDLTPTQKNAIETACKVSLYNDLDAATITVVPNIPKSNPQDCFPFAAKQAVLEILRKNQVAQSVRNTDVSNAIRDAKAAEIASYPLKRRKSEVRSIIRAAEGLAAPANDTPLINNDAAATAQPITLTPQNADTEAFVRQLAKKKGDDALKAFAEDPRVAVTLAFRKDSEKPPVLEMLQDWQNPATSIEKQTLVGRVLATAAQRLAENQNVRIDYQWMVQAIDSTFAEPANTPAEKPTRAARESATRNPKPTAATVFPVKIDVVNANPLHDLVEHLTHPSRSAALSAFADSRHPLLEGLRVITNTKSQPYSFSVHVPMRDGIADKNVLDFVCSALNDANVVFEKSRKLVATDNKISVQKSALDKAWFRDWINENLPLLESAPEKLSPQFRNTADVTVELKSPKVDTPALGKPIENQRVAYVTRGAPALIRLEHKFNCSVNFRLPDFDDNGEMTLYKPTGEERKIILTPNQANMLSDIMDPGKKIIFVDGPPGTGKSLLAAWAQLHMLKTGAIFRAYYERPLETVGGKEVGFLKGTLDQKVGPHNQAFEDIYRQLLGFGNMETGGKVLEQLQTAEYIVRFDGLFARGDTIYDSFLFVDEAQNKKEGELWNLLTRAEDTKVVLSGDTDTQVDIRNSGFSECFGMYNGLEEVKFHHMTAEDIKRSALIRKLYEARKDYRDRMTLEGKLRNGPGAVPQPR